MKIASANSTTIPLPKVTGRGAALIPIAAIEIPPTPGVTERCYRGPDKRAGTGLVGGDGFRLGPGDDEGLRVDLAAPLDDLQVHVVGDASPIAMLQGQGLADPMAHG